MTVFALASLLVVVVIAAASSSPVVVAAAAAILSFVTLLDVSLSVSCTRAPESVINHQLEYPCH